MSIKVSCDKCKSVFNVDEKLAWKKGKCSKCSNLLEIPLVWNNSDTNFLSEKQDIKDYNSSPEKSSDSVKEEKSIKENDTLWASLWEENKLDWEKDMPKVKVKSKKSKWIRFILFSFLFFLLIILSYWYYLYKENPSDNIIVNNKFFKTYIYDNSNSANEDIFIDNSWFHKPKGLNKNNDLNLAFNLKSNYEISNSKKTILKWFLNLDNVKIISQEWGLKQQIRLEQVSWQNSFNNKKTQFIVKNIDFVSDYDKLYFFIWEWYELILRELNLYGIINNWKTTRNILSKIKDIFKDKKYVFIDNWKSISNSIWEIWRNNIIKWIIKWISTSNLNSYLVKSWIDANIKNYILRDKFLDYLLIKTKENKYEINKDVCNYIVPITRNVSLNSFYADLVNVDDLQNLCSRNVWYISSLLWYFDEIKVVWDKQKWDFKILFLKSKKEIISVEYKNHSINLWNIDFNNGIIKFKSNWNKFIEKSSLFNVNSDFSWTKFKWEIVNWKWNIEVDSKKIKLRMSILDYYIDNYNFSYISDSLELNSNYKKSEFSFDVYFTGESTIKSKFSYINWKVNWFVKVWDLLNYVFNWKFHSYKDFNLIVIDDNLWKQIDINSKDDKNIVNYKISSTDRGVQTSSWLIVLSKKNLENDATIFDIKWNIDYSYIDKLDNLLANEKSEDEEKLDTKEWWFISKEWQSLDLDNNINFNISIDYKSWLEKYVIPEKYKEIEIVTNKMIKLPYLWLYNWIDKKSIVTFWWIWVWLSIAYSSLSSYFKEFDNSKSDSSINKISSLIDEKINSWVSLKDLIVNNEKYKWNNIFVWWRKLVFWQNYFVWTPNYQILWIQKDDYLTPDWWEYLIWATTVRNKFYQILWIINSQSWEKEYFILWNYKPNPFKILKSWIDYENQWEPFNTIKLIWNKNIWLLKKWDIIWWKEIIKISNDWLYITFDKKIKSKSILVKPDAKWLISINWKVIKDWDIKE